MNSKNNKYIICFVNPHYYKFTIGGAEVQMYLLAREFIKRGWEVHYVTSDTIQKTKDEDITLHPFFEGSRRVSKNYRLFKSILSEIDADIYYQRGRKMSSFYTSKYCKENGKPFIFSTSMDIDCRRFKQVPRAANNILDLFRIKRHFKSLIEDIRTLNTMKAADIVLCQSMYQQNAIRKNLGIESTIFKNVHPVPDEDKIIKDDKFIVLWLANIKEWKQPEIFLSLVDKLHGLDCHFILAGRMSSEKFRQPIEKTQKLYKNFLYIENVSFERSNELIEQASIFVNTSLPNEGFPNTFIQSWLRKTPTVSLSFDPDGIIKAQNIGFVSNIFDQLVKDVKTLIIDAALRKRMGEKAREYAIQEYSVANNFDRFYNLVASIK